MYSKACVWRQTSNTEILCLNNEVTIHTAWFVIACLTVWSHIVSPRLSSVILFLWSHFFIQGCTVWSEIGGHITTWPLFRFYVWGHPAPRVVCMMSVNPYWSLCLVLHLCIDVFSLWVLTSCVSFQYYTFTAVGWSWHAEHNDLLV